MPPRSISERKKYYLQRRLALENAIEKSGALRRQDWWSLDYFKDPYLIETPTQKLHKRYQDIIGNTTILDPSGKISFLMGKDRDAWMSLAMHVQDELFARGIMPQRADDDIHLPNPTFPESPPGIKILGGRLLPSSAYLVKIGEYAHMRAMVETGEILISPASTYTDKSLTTAIRDDELKLFANCSASNIHKTALGRSVAHKFDLKRPGEITITRTLHDFYAYCLTHRYDHRLLDDFHKDSIVIINEPTIFLTKLAKAVESKYTSLLARVGAIGYYDPYFVEDWSREADGFLKHFRYAYQKEFRLCWNVPTESAHAFKPFFVNIGDMRSYAELLTISKQQL